MTLRRFLPVVGTAVITTIVFLNVGAGDGAPDWTLAWTAVQGVPMWLILVSLCLALSQEFIVGPYKWRRVVQQLGLSLPFREALLVRLGSQPIRSVAPLKSGELASALYLKRVHKLPGGPATSTVLFEKMVNLWATVALMLAGLALIGQPLLWCVVGLWALLPFIRGPWRTCATFLDGKMGRVGRFASGLLRSFLVLPPAELAVQQLLALLFTGLEVFNAWLLLGALGAVVPFEVVLLVIPLSYFLNNVPVSILGIGVREGLFVLCFVGYATPTLLLVAGVAVSVFEYIVPTLCGLFYLRPFLGRCVETR